MRLFELGTRPWEAKTPEEAKRIAAYEVFCNQAAAKAQDQETRMLLKNRK